METLERAEIERVRAEFGDALVKVKTFRENLFLCVDKARLKEIAMFLRDDPAFEYKQFSDCTCCDYSKWPHERDLPQRFEVIYNLYSIKNASRLES